MVDIPGDSSTTRTITVGGSLSDSLETTGDHDWIRIQLTAGQSISVFVDGLTLEDAYLRIRDASGNVIYENDDISAGVNRDSLIAFTATYTGTYFIDVAAWVPDPGDEPPGYTGTGTYTVSVSPYTPPPLGTVQQLADYLVSGHWGGDERHFNVTPGGSITVNLTALTAPAQTLAIAALGTWSDIIGINFVQVSTGGQITFDDNQEGAFSTSIWSNGIITSSRVNVSVEWLADYGTSLNGYSFQTYIHEIGHALGLGHQGGYNGEARYPYDAEYQNDGWPLSVMSYFDQSDNTYFAGQGFDFNFITTPMMADILAMSMLYGLSTTTRAGDTVYGPGWSSTMGALCIFDSGGIDTINVSGLAGSHKIDLHAGTFSNVLGEVGNVSIALGVVIENAIGGSGNDQLVGNSANNILDGGAGDDSIVGWEGDDILIGGAGNDSLSGTDGFDTADYSGAAAGIRLAGRTVTSMSGNSAGIGTDDLFGIERIIGSPFADSMTGYNLDDETFTGGLGADILTGNGGNDSFLDTAAGLNGDTITDFATGDRIIISNASLAGFSFSLNGSTLSYTGGSLSLTGFAGQLVASAAAGGGVVLSVGGATSTPTSFITIRADFNGDGRDDVLWRHDGGTITNWLGTASGGFLNNHANAGTAVPNDWKVVGSGDFNGDGRDDILWRHDGGTITDWLGTANGGFVNNHANAGGMVPNDWKVVGVGDFNGDGRSDILWRHSGGTITDWLGTASGGFTNNHANAGAAVPTDWNVVGVGDYNGDGRSDILWRHDGGTITNWLGTASGGFTNNHANAATALSNLWEVIGTGDFNGDGRDDFLVQHADGRVTNWLGTASGGFTSNEANVMLQMIPEWSTVAGIGDYNGDGRDDILWRHDNGQVRDWLGTATGAFTPNDANSLTNVPNDWHVQSPEVPWI